MTTRILVLAETAAAAIGLVAGPAASGPAYGKQIQDCFGTTYGLAKNAAWEGGHATPPALGAKLTFIAHEPLCAE
jgi:hypothetical protein